MKTTATLKDGSGEVLGTFELADKKDGRAAPNEVRQQLSDGELSSDTAKELRLYFERVERLNSEIEDIQDDRKQVLEELESRGFDKAIFLLCLRRRKLERKGTNLKEIDTLVEVYEDAVATQLALDFDRTVN